MNDETRHQLALDMLKEVIERDIEIPLKTFGSSMTPVICCGEWIVVRRALESEIQVGDIIIYQVGHTFVAHRVIRRVKKSGRTCFQVKGDAHLVSEGVLPAGQVIARVIGLKKGRRVISLEQPVWRRANRVIARYSSVVDMLCRRLPSRPDPSGPAGRLVTALVRLPPRLLMAVGGLAASFSWSSERDTPNGEW